MENQRLIYRVILKVSAVLALMILTWVFVNSLFTQTDKSSESSEKAEQINLIKIDLSEMLKGNIQKVRLGNQEVSILYRKVSAPLEKLKTIFNKDVAIHPENSDFYVFYNYGDSGNCPLFYSKDTLKDTCSGKVFNTFGQEINNQNNGFQLKIPPHYFEGGKLFLGKWKK